MFGETVYAEIVSIGEELLSSESETIDTNSVFITQQLGKIGIRVLYKTTVGDDEARITDVLKLALRRADIVITSGGLGPTVDDMTRQGVAEATGVGLEFRQDLLDGIAAKFARFGVRMSDNNRVQAMLPANCTAIDNPVGTAPGFMATPTVDGKQRYIFSVPGVPREMKAMMEITVIPYLKQKLGVGVIRTRVLRTAGIGESMIDEQIGHLEKLSNPTVGLNAHSGQTDIRITARTKTDGEADALIAQVENEVREKLGTYIFGVDKEILEEVFMNLLAQGSLRVAIAEIGTGNALRRRLTRWTEKNHPEWSSLIAPLEEAQITEMRQQMAGGDGGRVGAEKLCAAMLSNTGAGVAVAVIADDNGMAIAATNGSDLRTRSYAYDMAMGGAEWAAGWGLSMTWWLLAQRSKRG